MRKQKTVASLMGDVGISPLPSGDFDPAKFQTMDSDLSLLDLDLENDPEVLTQLEGVNWKVAQLQLMVGQLTQVRLRYRLN